MEKIALFYGSDTGCTEAVVAKIQDLIDEELLEIYEMSAVKNTMSFAEHNHILIGVPTWYDGDLQSDWEAFLEDFKTIDFSGKIVAIFGLGDQMGYGEYFVDGIGTLGNIVMENGGQLVGAWSVEGYDFEESVALFEYEGEKYFMGLALDEDNQPEMTDERLQVWVQSVLEEFQLKETI